MFKEEVSAAFMDLQQTICKALELADGSAKFEEQVWQDENAKGQANILQKGAVIEKGGVNFTAIGGTLSERLKKIHNSQSDSFFATGLSIVIHPENPFMPIIHMNIRYFELEKGVSWFGGGMDLTPHYVIPTDARYFHYHLKQVCDRFNPDFYTRFKNNADDYFYIKHRKETRGIGGIFYDKLSVENTKLSLAELLAFSLAVGHAFVPIYTELIDRNRNTEYEAIHKEWQLLRRSRYAEFNLVYDSGTKFGLENACRVENVLMSMPPLAKWTYNGQEYAQQSSLEAETLKMLRKGIDWLSK